MNMRPDADNFDDEISLLDLFDILLKRWYWVVGLGAVSAVIAFVACLSIPSQYQASTLLQIGRLGGLPSSSSSSSSSDIESPQALVERINTGGFAQRLASEGPGDTATKASIAKNTKLIRLETQGPSPERARQGLERAISLIQTDHRTIADPIERTLTKTITRYKTELDAVLQASTRLSQQAQQSGSSKGDSLTLLIFSQAQEQLNGRRIDLQEKISNAESNLQEQAAFGTMPVTPFYAGSYAVYPKTTLVALVALLAGAFAGVIIIFILNAYEARRKITHA
jgi:hypothetical protein